MAFSVLINNFLCIIFCSDFEKCQSKISHAVVLLCFCLFQWQLFCQHYVADFYMVTSKTQMLCNWLKIPENEV